MSIPNLSRQEWLFVVTTVLLAALGKVYIDYVSLRMPATNNTRVEQGFKHIHNISGSSVWCLGTNHTNRMCHFRNLCYSTSKDYFLMFHGKESVLEGLPRDRHDPALLDFSSLHDHSAKYFSYVDVPLSAFKTFNACSVSETSLIASRFHPDNIMHVFHDDLLPMWYTMKLLRYNYNTGKDVHLVLMDDNNSSDFTNLYQMLSTLPPFLKADLVQSGYELVCFEEAFVGLSKTTVWYDYGFKEPQHPLPSKETLPSTFQEFTKFVSNKLSISRQCDPDTNYIVMVTRKYNRMIVNEVELSLRLMRDLSMKIVSVSLETHSVGEIIQTITCAKVMLGMHGSLMILGMFLPPRSILLELFPYAVNPEHYTPYKTMCEVRGQEVMYLSWRNTNVQNTVIHPDDDPETGGIHHLPRSEQLRILASDEVPLHLCCADPEWLFRIYQDTIVDVDEIVTLLQSTLSNLSLNGNNVKIPGLLPSLVQDVSCETQIKDGDSDRYFYVRWTEPWNTQFLEGSGVQYEVWVQETDKLEYVAYKTTNTFLMLEARREKYYVWVKCLFDNVEGPLPTFPVTCSRS